MSDLRSTVEGNPNVFEVYFDTNGEHYFIARKVGGVAYGQFFQGSPILSSRIINTQTREQVLGISRNFDTTDKQNYTDEFLDQKEERLKETDTSEEPEKPSKTTRRRK